MTTLTLGGFAMSYGALHTRDIPRDAAEQPPEPPLRTIDVMLRYRADRFAWRHGESVPTSFLLGATPAENSIHIDPEFLPLTITGSPDNMRVTGQRVDLTRRGQLIMEHIVETFGVRRFPVWYAVSEDSSRPATSGAVLIRSGKSRKASLMVAAEIPIAVVSTRLGHCSISHHDRHVLVPARGRLS